MLFLAYLIIGGVSQNLINNDVWYDTADRIFSCVGKCKIKVVREVPATRLPILFVSQQFIQAFVEFQPSEQYIIVSSNNLDYCTPFGSGTNEAGDHLLDNQNLIAWFGTNMAKIHPKLHALPLGPKTQWTSTQFHDEKERKKILSNFLSRNNAERNFYDLQQRPRLLELSMTVSSADSPRCKLTDSDQSRRAAAAHFKHMERSVLRKSFGDCPSKQQYNLTEIFELQDNNLISQAQYFNKLRCTKFVPAPEGNGLDTHRFYESLLMGAIPIVIDLKPMQKLFEGLPVLAIDSWKVLTIEFLENVYEKMHDRTKKYNWSLLTSKPWLDEIEKMATKAVKISESPTRKQRPVRKQAPLQNRGNTKPKPTAVQLQKYDVLPLIKTRPNYVDQTPTLAAVIVDNRFDELTVHSILDARSYLPKDTPIIVVTTKKFKYNYLSIAEEAHPLFVRDEFAVQENTKDTKFYSELLTNKEFWRRITTAEYVLVFQRDSRFCRQSKYTFLDFLGKYDYIGAPWIPEYRQEAKYCVGNGGFSLRRRQAMIDCVNIGFKKRHPEDVAFTQCLINGNFRMPNCSVAATFAVESYHENIVPVAAHALKLRLNSKDFVFMRKNCPEAFV